MSAWTTGIETAPKDGLILVRSPNVWGDVPAVLEWAVDVDDAADGWWAYAEDALLNYDVDQEALADCQWALIPE